MAEFDGWTLAQLERELDRVRDRMSHIDENYDKETARRSGAQLSQREDLILEAIEKLEEGEPSLEERVDALSLYMSTAQRKIMAMEEQVKWHRELLAVLVSKMTQSQYVMPVMDMKQWEELMRRGPTCEEETK